MTIRKHSLIARNARLSRRIDVPNFEIRSGECVVLCGPNGSGKSSMLRLLAGLEPRAEGDILLDGSPLLSRNRREIASLVAWLPQRPYLGEVVTCEAIVAAARFRFMESPALSRKEARRILERQEIAHLADRPAQEVSGGELQRVLIASLIAQDAPFMLVDEPANHLDPRHQVEAYQELGRLWQKEGKAVIVVTHDVRLANLLGPPREVRTIGVQNGRLLPEIALSDPGLGTVLSELYGVPFVERNRPGGLSVDLDPFVATSFSKNRKDVS
jgi:iron complex transport system ATP-binding protein